MPTTQELRDQRANLWNQMQDVMNTARESGWTGELEQTYDRLEGDLDGLGDQIARDEAHARREQEFASVDRSGVVEPTNASRASGSNTYEAAFASYLRNGIGALDGESQRALRNGWVEGPQNAGEQGVGSGSIGGYLVPEGFRQHLAEAISSVVPLRQYAEVITTTSGNLLPWPTNDDTAAVGELLAENTQAAQGNMTFGTASLGAYMFSSKVVKVSQQLLTDSAFNLDQWLPTALGKRIGRGQAGYFTTGTGSAEPKGIIAGATVGVEASSKTAVTFGELVDLTESLDAEYLAGGNANWMLNQKIRADVRKLADNNGRPLWEPSVQAGVPDTLLGYGVVLNNKMADVQAQSAKIIGFGDIKAAYVIRDVGDVAVLRLSERYADFLQVGFLAFHRSDATTQDANAFKVLQNKTT